MKKTNNFLPIYLDYASSTPLDDRVIAKMHAVATSNYGNASAINHYHGRQAAEIVEQARATILNALHCRESANIIFTSGATEANNLAIAGAAKRLANKGKHIVTTAIEHKSILEVCNALSLQGYEISVVKPRPNGIIDQDLIAQHLRDDTILVTLAHVNNELGTINDVEAIATLTASKNIALHVDAAQSVGKIPINLQNSKINFISLSAHKAYGPKGVGALYIKDITTDKLSPQMLGGGQEFNLRSGTLATNQIAGMGEAYSIINDVIQAEHERLSKFRDELEQGLNNIGGIIINSASANTVSGILNFSVEGVDGEKLMERLSHKISISSGAACGMQRQQTSHVLSALGIPQSLARASVRLSFGRFTTHEDIQYVYEYLKEIIIQLR